MSADTAAAQDSGGLTHRAADSVEISRESNKHTPYRNENFPWPVNRTEIAKPSAFYDPFLRPARRDNKRGWKNFGKVNFEKRVFLREIRDLRKKFFPRIFDSGSSGGFPAAVEVAKTFGDSGGWKPPIRWPSRPGVQFRRFGSVSAVVIVEAGENLVPRPKKLPAKAL